MDKRPVLLELYRRARLKKLLSEHCHGKQRAFAFSRSKRTAARAGRRGGKSTALAGKFIATAIDAPDGLSVFIAISAARANEIVGDGLRKLGKAIGWRVKQTSRDGQLYWIFPNGHKLWVAGCKNKAECEKFRGSPYHGAAVDEADSIRSHLEYLVDDVLDPCLMDYNGWLALTGTPGVTPIGYFWEITTGEGRRKQWETHHWTCLDNPFLRDPIEFLRVRREEMGLNEASPTYLREWLGQWVRDLSALCYPYDPTRNSIAGPLEGYDWRYVLAIDLGVVDATAFVVLAYRDRDTNIYIVESTSCSGLSPSQAGQQVGDYRARYPGCRIVADTGGIGRGFTQEWATRFGIYAEAAHKADATAQIALAGDLVRSGSVKLLPGASSLAREWSTLPWDIDRKGHDPAYADHESSAARYGLMAIRPMRVIVAPGAEENSEAARNIEERKRKEAVLAGARRQSVRGR